jgi:serine/threonine protein kinase
LKKIAQEVHNEAHLSAYLKSGTIFRVTETLIGRGSYGKVFKAQDENNRTIAVKCCPLSSKGIPGILECSIMSTLIHPHLNRALKIRASLQTSKLYIFQELAVSDFSQYIRKNKDHYQPNNEELKNWTFSLCSAVQALHENQIIHGDIKISNILLYHDGSIRLTDFTLATKQWKKTDTFQHMVGTYPFRPLECFLNKNWDKSLDIWSLGCTLYGIAYGEPLFPCQTAASTTIDVPRKEMKLRLFKRYINAILHWHLLYPDSQSQLDLPRKFNITYLPPKIVVAFQQSHQPELKHLLLSILKVDPKSRPSIERIIAHPYFFGKSLPSYLMITKDRNPSINKEDRARVAKGIKHYLTDDEMVEVALKIYTQSQELKKINEKTKIMACILLTLKLFNKSHSGFVSISDEIARAEIEISNYLSFRLHE